MAATSATNRLQVFRVRNTTGSEQELWIEPLGDRVVLSPDVLYEISVSDVLEEIDFSSEGFVVHGWVKRIASIDSAGNETTIWDYPPKS